jgi:hypothetical protein
MILKHLGVTDIATQCIDTLVAAYVIILKTDAPRAAADVRKPDLNE